MDRKLVKQTVMTSVYGVTYIGARDQIKRRLKERGAISDDSEIFGCACYAAKVMEISSLCNDLTFYQYISRNASTCIYQEYYL